MVARTRPDDKFIITLWRRDDVLDAATATSGERALKAAIVMLPGQDALESGDKLTVTEA